MYAGHGPNSDSAKTYDPTVSELLDQRSTPHSNLKAILSNIPYDIQRYRSNILEKAPAMVVGGVVGGMGANYIGEARKMRQKLHIMNDQLIVLRGMLTVVKPRQKRQKMMKLLDGIIRSQHPQQFRSS